MQGRRYLRTPRRLTPHSARFLISKGLHGIEDCVPCGRAVQVHHSFPRRISRRTTTGSYYYDYLGQATLAGQCRTLASSKKVTTAAFLCAPLACRLGQVVLQSLFLHAARTEEISEVLMATATLRPPRWSARGLLNDVSERLVGLASAFLLSRGVGAGLWRSVAKAYRRVFDKSHAKFQYSQRG